eukprot:733803-Prymnesium_polylepis.1
MAHTNSGCLHCGPRDLPSRFARTDEPARMRSRRARESTVTKIERPITRAAAALDSTRLDFINRPQATH